MSQPITTTIGLPQPPKPPTGVDLSPALRSWLQANVVGFNTNLLQALRTNLQSIVQQVIASITFCAVPLHGTVDAANTVFTCDYPMAFTTSTPPVPIGLLWHRGPLTYTATNPPPPSFWTYNADVTPPQIILGEAPQPGDILMVMLLVSANRV